MKKSDMTLRGFIYVLVAALLVSCQKEDVSKVVVTGDAGEIQAESVKLAGSITSIEERITNHGHCWSKEPGPTISSSKTDFYSCNAPGDYFSVAGNLEAGTKYYYRSYVKFLGDDVSYGEEKFFTTLDGIAEISTLESIVVTVNSCRSGGVISSDGGSAISVRGVCWSTEHYPTITDSKTVDGSGMGSFSSLIDGLTENSIYYIRAYSTNGCTTTYGEEKEVFTVVENSGTFTDIRDGKTYKWLRIGDQIWMGQNLSYLPSVSPPSVGSDTEPHYYVYNYHGTTVADARTESNYLTYGALYNWPAAKEAAPVGWHIPSFSELSELQLFLGGENLAGGKLKESGTNHWINNVNGNNLSGFTALPGGIRWYYYNSFEKIGTTGDFWSSTERLDPYLDVDMYIMNLWSGSGYMVITTIRKDSGLSIRCLLD